MAIKQESRLSASWKIEEALNENGFRARVWRGGQVIRVYVADRKGDLGHLDVGFDGTITPTLSRQKGSIMALVPAMNVMPERPAVREQQPAEDEDSRLMRESVERTGENERTREEG